MLLKIRDHRDSSSSTQVGQIATLYVTVPLIPLAVLSTYGKISYRARKLQES